jgi:hypothetical protein
MHTTRHWPQLPPWAVAVLCGLLPVVTVHVTYALSIAGGLVPACMPYVEGCTSISATGREGPGYLLFKGGMLPSAALLIAYWRLCRTWLLESGDTDGPGVRLLIWLGTAGAIFLVLYTLFLGHRGDVYSLLRRFGVSLHLGLTTLAQLLLVWRLGRLRALTGTGPCPPGILRAKTWLVTLLVSLGVGSIPVSNFIANKDPVENAIEWVFCLLLSGFYLLTAATWHRSGFRPPSPGSAAGRPHAPVR